MNKQNRPSKAKAAAPAVPSTATATSFADWIAATPRDVVEGAQMTVNVPITMDALAWFNYARCANAQNRPIAEVLSEILDEDGCDYLNRGMKTTFQAERDRETQGENGGGK